MGRHSAHDASSSSSFSPADSSSPASPPDSTPEGSPTSLSTPQDFLPSPPANDHELPHDREPVDGLNQRDQHLAANDHELPQARELQQPQVDGPRTLPVHSSHDSREDRAEIPPVRNRQVPQVDGANDHQSDALETPQGRSTAESHNRGARGFSLSAMNWPQRLLAISLVFFAFATVIGLITQWPSDEPPRVSEQFKAHSGMTGELRQGEVQIVQPGACNSPSVGRVFDTAPQTDPNAPQDCTHAIISINSGPDAGKRTLLEVHPEIPGNPDLRTGDKIQLSGHTDPSSGIQYGFQDFQRTTNLALWLVATLVLIIVVGAWRGARSIIGLVLTLGLIVTFLVPGLVRGGDPVALAVTCGAAVLFLVLFLVHGFSWKTAAAMGGTLLALGLSTILSKVAVASAGLRGLGDENNLSILVYLPGISITGLLLAGMIVGALGVLNDVTIAQASTVNELHELDPQASPWHLFRSGMKVGRDHIASMVYTLVLSYTGVALPTILLLSISNRPLEQILTSDIMATEILRSATGAMALVLAVPLTTFIAAWTSRPDLARANHSHG